MYEEEKNNNFNPLQDRTGALNSADPLSTQTEQ
jgi:DNA polymerase epsilon subunit 1